MLSTLVPLVLTIVLSALGALHVAWAARATGPGGSVIPESEGKPLFTPSRRACALIALGLFCSASIAASRGQLVFPSRSGSIVHWAATGAGVIFLLRAVGDFRYVGFFKSRRGSRFAVMDTWVYSPLCLAIAAGFFFVTCLP